MLTMLPLTAIVLLILVPTAQAAFRTCVCCMTSSFDSALNVRDSPSTAGNVVGVIYPNECLEASSCSGGWCTVTFEGQTRYVSHDFVSGPQQCGDPDTGTCFDTHCGFGGNVGRTCDAQGCGHYGAPRGSRSHAGTDVECSANEAIYAPFDGIIIYPVPPYGDGSCCDDGFEFESTDSDFPGYSIRVFYADGYTVGASYSKGQQIASHIGLQCGCYGSSMTDHSHVEVWLNRATRIDPTSFLYCNYK